MKRRILYVLGVVLLTAVPVFSQASFEPDEQVWNDTQFIVPLDKDRKWNAFVWTFGRFGNRLRTTTDARVGLFLTRKMNSKLTVGGGWLYRYSNPTFVQRRYEGRFLGIATLTLPLTKNKKWTLVNRNLYQYEDRYSRPNATIIRNRFWLKREVTIAKRKIEPFAAYESFYDFRLGGFARHRFQFGATRKFNAHFAGDFFYVRQNETGNGRRPGSVNGFGTSFRVSF